MPDFPIYRGPSDSFPVIHSNPLRSTFRLCSSWTDISFMPVFFLFETSRGLKIDPINTPLPWKSNWEEDFNFFVERGGLTFEGESEIEVHVVARQGDYFPNTSPPGPQRWSVTRKSAPFLPPPPRIGSRSFPSLVFFARERRATRYAT